MPFEHIHDYPYPPMMESLEKVQEWSVSLWRALQDSQRYFQEDFENALSVNYAFKTITGITNDVVADQAGDTLTLSTSAGFLTITGTAATDTIDFVPLVKDEDDMASDSALHMATQQSIKAYVDSLSQLDVRGGFEDPTAVVLSSDGGTPPTITLTFTGTVYFWSGGIQYSKTGSENIQIDDTNGVHVIYYDGSTLSKQANPSHAQFDTILIDKCIVAYVYWNTNLNTTPVLASELHGVVMSGETHHYLHDVFGAKWRDGGTISGYTLDTATDIAVSFDLTDIEIYDEDLKHTISDGVASNQYEQVLTGDAEIPVLYKDTSGIWAEQAASTLPYIVQGGDTYPSYNDDAGGGTWNLVELGNQKYALQFLIATNDWQYPVKMVIGSEEYNTAASARAAISTEVINWGTMPASEFVVLYVFVIQASAGGTKNVKIIDIRDFRFEGISGSSYTPTDHGVLSGLSDDDHLQYIKDSEFTQANGVLIGTGAGTFSEGVIGVDIQAYDAFLASIADLTDPDADRIIFWDDDGSAMHFLEATEGIQISVQNLLLDVNGLGEDAGVTSGDFFVYYDTVDGVHYKVDYDNMPGAAASCEWTGDGASGIYFDDGGSVTVGTTSKESHMTEGITIYQGTDDDHILSLQASEVAHGFTTRADTYTFGFMKKSVGASGGLDIWGLSDGNTEGLRLIGLTQTASSTHGSTNVAPVEIWGGEKSGTDGSALEDDDHLCVFSNWGTNVLYVTGDGSLIGIDTGATAKWILGDTACADVTTGLVINQRGADDDIFVAKSTDVAHACTTRYELDSYFGISKVNATAGGAVLLGISTATIALNQVGVSTVDNTTKGDGAEAPLLLKARKISGSDWGACGADANLMVVANHSTEVWGVDAEGDVWQSGDLLLANNLSIKSRDAGNTTWGKLLWMSASDNTVLNATATNVLQFAIAASVIAYFDTNGYLYINNMRSGATQVGAGASAGELWKTASHASLPDNVVMIGV